MSYEQQAHADPEIQAGRSTIFQPSFDRGVRSAARAIKRLALCSNDRFARSIVREAKDIRCRGAACHARLLVPETSCEARNTRLDRGLLIQTVLGGRFPLLS